MRKKLSKNYKLIKINKIASLYLVKLPYFLRNIVIFWIFTIYGNVMRYCKFFKLYSNGNTYSIKFFTIHNTFQRTKYGRHVHYAIIIIVTYVFPTTALPILIT